MPKIKNHTPSDFPQFMRIVEKFQEKNSEAWFRGVGDESRALVPSIARPASVTTPEEVAKNEKKIASAFAQRSPPFVQTSLRTDLNALFFMQHYGIPTRLLDWTESPFVALYFALTSVQRDPQGAPLTDAAVWLCAPVLWNRAALKHISFEGGILDEGCEEIKAYLPSLDFEQRTMAPIMIYGTHNSPRIVAQRGVFALFGKGLDAMETLALKAPYPAGVLQKVTIAKDRIEPMLQGLFRNGMSESVIYPDLSGLSLEIRRMFGYNNG